MADQHTILVSGATGQQGGAVARHLLEGGYRVRALTRNPDQDAARALTRQGAEVVAGRFGDRASLDRALDGIYGVYSVQNSWTAGVEGEVREGRAFAEAAHDAGVRHFIYSSVASAHRQTGIPHFESKWEIEQYVRQLDLPFTILRPAYFMNNWARLKDSILGGRLPQPLAPNTPLQQIAVDDIGAFAAIAFSDPDTWIGRAIDLAGDELSMSEVAGTFSRVLDRPVEYVQVPWDAFRKQAGEEVTAMYRWFEDEGYEVDIAALREIHPLLIHLEPFLRAQDWIRAATREQQVQA